MRVGALVVGLLVALASASSLHGASNSGPKVDPFKVELDHLRRQRLADGREPIVAGFERFIERHLADPRVAEAMLDLASCFESEIRAAGILSDPESALPWYRRAVATAAVGSELWNEAQFLLVGRVHDRDERRQILESIVENCDRNPVIVTRVEAGLMRVCIDQRKFTEAEQHCLTVMNWHENHDPKELAKIPMGKWEIDSQIRQARSEMMGAWVTAPWPKAERMRKVKEFQARHRIVNVRQDRAFESAVKSIAADGNP